MSHHPVVPVSFSGRAGRNVCTCKRLFLFALAYLALNTCVSAFALTPTTTTLTVTSAGSAVTTVAGQTVITLTATVEAGTTPLTVGQVNFCDAAAAHCTDIHLLGTAQLTSAGTAVLKFRPGIGSHSYNAVFPGTKTYASSFSGDSALTATGKFATTTTIAQSGAFDNYSLTATVAAFSNVPSSDSLTGLLSFLDTNNGDAVLGTADLGEAVAGLSWFNSQSPATGYSPRTIAVGDFNGDGILDFAVANDIIPRTSCVSSTLTVMLGNGDGTFTAAPSPAAGCAPNSITAGDFNGDGKLDLAIADQFGSNVTILLGNGDGTFTPAAMSPAITGGPCCIVAGDFNGDGNEDLVVANEGGGGDQGQTSFTVLLGNGDGTFNATTVASPQQSVILSVTAGDLNGDGKQDLAVTYEGNGISHPLLAILLGNGNGTFTAAPNVTFGPGTSPVNSVVGDFNGDGKLDLAVTDPQVGLTTILLGNGDGTFTAGQNLSSTPNLVSVGDFNGDGIADLVLTSPSNSQTKQQYTFFLGIGNGTFSATAGSPVTVPGAFQLASTVVGDFNGDGLSDLVSANIIPGTESDPSPPGSAPVLLTQQTLTTAVTLSGFSLPANSGAHEIEASYPGDTNYKSSVSGTTALTTGQIVFSTTNLSFGNEDVGYSTNPQAVTVANNTSSSMAIASIKLTGADITSFVTSNTCPPSLAVGASCRIGVRFVPTALGPATAAVTLTDSALNSPQNIMLSGTGINASAASLSLSEAILSFGTERGGESTSPKSVTVTNTSSSASVYFKSITLGGADASSFVTSNTCGGSVGGTLAAGATCRIGVRFAPQTGGQLSATITLTDNAGGSPQTISLSGTGIGALAILSPNGHQFGNEPVGDSTDADTVTLSNNGYLPLEISSIRLTGADVSSFATSNTCGVILAAGQSCRIGMRFAPVGLGPASANITLTDNAPDSPQTITLNGTGITPPAASLSLSTTSLAFGNETVGLSTGAQNVTVTNTSTTTTLYFKTITLSGANASSFVTSNTCNGPAGNGLGGSLAPGAQCRIGARFIPKTTGPLTATITLTDSAVGSPQTITLTGTGQ